MNKHLTCFVLASTLLLSGCVNGKTTASSAASSATATSAAASSKGATSAASSASATSTSSSSTSASSSVTAFYNVRFLNSDNSVLQDTIQVEDGKFATYQGETPTKEYDDFFTYSFKGWDQDPATTPIHKDTDFIAQYDTTRIGYTVTFKNPDGTIIFTENIGINSTPICSEDPYMKPSASVYYTFKSWDKEIVPVTDSDVTYTAVYDETPYTLTYALDAANNYWVTGVGDTSLEGLYVPATHAGDDAVSHPVIGVRANALKSCFSLQIFALSSSVTTLEDQYDINSRIVHYMVDDGSPFTPVYDTYLLLKGTVLVGLGGFDCFIGGKLDLPDGITELAPYVSYYKHHYSYLTIPNTVKKIGADAFAGSYAQTIDLGTGLEEIANYALFNCTALTSLTLPASLKSIGEDGLSRTTKLTSLSYAGTKADWAKVSLGTNWHLDAAFTAVTCSDGDITL